MDLERYLKEFSETRSNTTFGKRSLVVGLSPTARLISMIDTADRFIVALNGAWILQKSHVCLTIHPLDVFSGITSEQYELIPNTLVVGAEKWRSAVVVLGNTNPGVLNYIQDKVKVVEFLYRVRHDYSLPHESKMFGRLPQLIHRKNGNFLYVWTSIAQTAMHFLYKAGFDIIELLGCESISFRSERRQYVHAGRTRWNGVPSAYRLNTYAQGNIEMASTLRDLGVKIYSVSPLVSLNSSSIETQFAVVKKLLLDSKLQDTSKFYVASKGFFSYTMSTVFGYKIAYRVLRVLGNRLKNLKKALKSSRRLRLVIANTIYFYLKYFKLRACSSQFRAFGNYYLPKGLDLNNCSVISLGVGNDLSFEKALLDEYRNLEIHIGDPTPEVVHEIVRRKNGLSSSTEGDTSFRWKNNTAPFIEQILEKVVFHPYGVSNRDEELTFYRKSAGLNSSALPLHNSVPSERVRMLDILRFLDKVTYPVAVLKLDVEGFAPRVIRRLLVETKLRPIIVGEFEVFSIGDSLLMAREVHNLIEALETQGYLLFRTIANRKKTIEFACVPA